MLVQSKQASEQLCYSARLLQPFVKLLSPDSANGNGNGHGNGKDEDARLPVGLVHEWLREAIEKSGDPELGLKAGALVTPGDVGVIDYVLSSAPTVSAAVAATCRYMRLLNEALECRLDTDDGCAVLRMEARAPLPAAAEDFMLAGYYTSHAWVRSILNLECWFMHAAPSDLGTYRRVFGETVLRFSSPCSGFAFSGEQLEQPLAEADGNLHVIVRRLADSLLAELPNDNGAFSDRVRSLLSRELATPGLSTAWAARQLRMSVRTLARRLEVENTSFYTLLDEARHARALRLIGDGRLTLAEIAFVLGFSHVTSFHRAFRRWTGRTPADYRAGSSASASQPSL